MELFCIAMTLQVKQKRKRGDVACAVMKEPQRNHQIQFKPQDYPFIATDFPKSGLFSELHQ